MSILAQSVRSLPFDTNLAVDQHATAEEFRIRLDEGIRAGLRYAGTTQDEAGWWCGLLRSNSTMEAEWILAMAFLGVDDAKLPGMAQAILAEQRADGSWENFRDAPAGDISTTVECYAALRAVGYAPDFEPLARAREWIFAHGGVARVRVFTKIWLALFGEWPWDGTPTLPPELILLPAWVPFNIYHFASWARGTMVPLAVLSALRPVRPLPPEARLDELFPDGREAIDYRLPRRGGLFTWNRLFLWLDRAMNWISRQKIYPQRREAIRLCLQWIIERQEYDGCWGGIQPPWVYSLMALHAGGYDLRQPVLARGLAASEAPWSYQANGGTYIQACMSPVWDTVLMLQAILDCGVDEVEPEVLERAVDWLLGEQIDQPGDWAELTPHIKPGGWAFEFHNDWYPDIDDTGVVVGVWGRLQQLRANPRLRESAEKALGWLRGMTSKNGAWGAFDRDNTAWIIAKIPFMDFGEALDPPSVDVTAHVIEALIHNGVPGSDPAVRRAVDYLWAEQEADGSWFGRWGVNHIYGTAAALPALALAGENMADPRVRRAATWLRERQNADGGWGESVTSYMDPGARGRGVSTASQTAWALMALVATGSHEHDAALEAGLEYLLSTQNAAGTWDEDLYTGTGFPGYGSGARVDVSQELNTHDQGFEMGRSFMINYELYSHYFPLSAMGRVRRHLAEASA